MSLESAIEYVEVVRQAEAALQGAESEPWFDRFDKELKRIEGALESLRAHHLASEGLELATALVPYWTSRGLIAEGRKWLSVFLAAPGEDVPDALKARALSNLGLLAFRQADNQEARRHFEESRAISNAIGDSRGLCTALLGLARVALRDGATDEAARYAEESLAISRQSGDRNEIRMPLHVLAEVTRMRGDYERARSLYSESIKLNRELGHQQRLPIELHNLAYVEKNLGNLEASAQLFNTSLRLAQMRGNLFIIPYCLIGMGGVAAFEGRPERAVKLLAAGNALLRATGVVMDPTDQPEYEKSVARACQDVDEQVFNNLWIEGEALTADEAIAYALDTADHEFEEV